MVISLSAVVLSLSLGVTSQSGVKGDAPVAPVAPVAPATPAVPVLPALPALPAVASTPAPLTIISIRPVAIAQSYPTDFRKEHPQVSAGWLVVIRADSALLAPRALAEPLLLASGSDWVESVEWFNHGFNHGFNQGFTSGHRVCFIPAPAGKDGFPSRSLTGLRMWFGSAQLPESVDAAILDRERADADVAKIAPLTAQQSQELTVAKGQDPLRAANRDELVAAIQALIAVWSPAEVPEAAPAAK